METDLSIRLHAYVTAAATPARGDTRLYADALASSRSASATASAGIICSHTRVLRADPAAVRLLPGQDELDLLIADKAVDGAANVATQQATGEPRTKDSPRQRLPLHAGKDTAANLALGAAGIPAIKHQNG